MRDSPLASWTDVGAPSNDPREYVVNFLVALKAESNGGASFRGLRSGSERALRPLLTRKGGKSARR